MTSIDDLVQALRSADSFDPRTFSTRLGNAVARHSHLSNLNGDFHRAQPDKLSEQETQTFVASVPSSATSSTANNIGDLTTGTFVLGVSRMQNIYGFPDAVKPGDGLTLAKVAMQRLLPSLYASHLNSELVKRNVATLQQFADDSTKVNEFQQKLKDPHFIRTVDNQIRNDTRPDRYTYRTNLLYVNEYFNNRGVPKASTNLQATDIYSAGSILQAWAEHGASHNESSPLLQSLGENDSNPSDRAIEDFAQLAMSLTAIYVPEGGSFEAQLGSYASPLMQHLAPNVRSQPKWPSLEASLRPYPIAMWQYWDKQIELMRETGNRAAQMSESVSVNTATRKDYYGRGFSRSMWYVDAFKPYFDPNKLSNEKYVDVSVVGQLTCFVPGTRILTKNGDAAIEDLGENDVVVTRFDPLQYGVCSDEKVAIPTGGKTMLCGINTEAPWFTPGHVFYTTTGLRAIDPDAAKEENPWVEVGSLQIGHVLLRANGGGAYERIQIEELQIGQVECDFVHGVHLREGLRSYHANGYLVHLNYPEITIKSIGRMLRKLQPSLQLEMLSKLRELTPIFGRFGASTVLDLLNHEMANDESLSKLRLQKTDIKKQPALRFQTKSFTLSPLGRYNLDLGSIDDLPRVDVYDGVLFLDGVYCEYARFGSRKVCWIRPVRDFWQYGTVSFPGEDRIFSGSGYVVHKFEHQSIDSSKKCHFRATSVTLRTPEQSAGADFAVGSASAEINGDTNPDATLTSAEQDPDKAGELSECGEWARNSLSVKSTLQDTYDLVYDEGEFTTITAPLKTPKSLFEIRYMSLSDQDGIETLKFEVPELDKIYAARRIAFQDRDSDKVELSSYYSSEVVLNERKNTIGVINITNPDLLVMASDQYTGADGALVYQNLTFKKAGSDLHLPFVMSGFCFSLDYEDKKVVSGLIRVYDPKMEGRQGRRYRLGGERRKVKSATVRSTAAMAVASNTQPGSPHLEFATFEDDTPLSVDELANLAVQDTLVKDDSQQMLHLAMLYHMDATDRKTFFGKDGPPAIGNDVDSPDKIPQELAGDLPANLSNWLKKTYANAYLCLIWSSQNKETQEKAHAVFTEKDKARIEYWWKGKGKKCMSRQPEYLDLNRLAATLAFTRQTPRIKDYMNDATELEEDDPILTQYPDLKTRVGELRGLTGGEKWSKMFFFHACESRFVDKVYKDLKGIQAKDPTSLTNTLTRHCTVMQSLHPMVRTEKAPPLDLRYAALVKRWIKTDQNDLGKFEGQIELLQENILDSLREWYRMILNGKDKFSPEISKRIKEEIDEIDKALHGGSASNEVIANRMAAVYADAVRGGYMTGTSDISLGALKKIQARFGAIDPQKLYKWMGHVTFTLTICGAAVFAYMSFGAWKEFGNLDAAQKATLILSTLQAATGLALGIYGSVRLWSGRDVDQLREGVELRAAAARNIENALRRRGSADEIPFQPRQRSGTWGEGMTGRNALDAERLEDIGAGVRGRSRSVAEHVFDHDAEKPRSNSPPPEGEEELGEMRDIKAKYSLTERFIRAAAAVLSLGLLILASLSVAKAWPNLAVAEKILHVLSLVHQCITLVVEIAMIFVAVAFWATIALVIIGAIIAIAFALWEKFKPREHGPIEKWKDERSHEFMDDAPEPPTPAFSWTVEPTKASVGGVSTVKVVGTALDRSKGIERLNLISLKFSSGTAQETALFDLPPDVNLRKKLPSDKDLDVNMVDFEMPETMKRDSNTALQNMSTLPTVINSTMIIQAKAPKKPPVKKGDPPPPPETPSFGVINVPVGTKIAFVMRAKIAKAPQKDPKQYSFGVTEQYVDILGRSEEVLSINNVTLEKS